MIKIAEFPLAFVGVVAVLHGFTNINRAHKDPPPVRPVDRCVVQEEEGGETETDGVTDGLDQGSLGLGGGG